MSLPSLSSNIWNFSQQILVAVNMQPNILIPWFSFFPPTRFASSPRWGRSGRGQKKEWLRDVPHFSVWDRSWSASPRAASWCLVRRSVPIRVWWFSVRRSLAGCPQAIQPYGTPRGRRWAAPSWWPGALWYFPQDHPTNTLWWGGPGSQWAHRCGSRRTAGSRLVFLRCGLATPSQGSGLPGRSAHLPFVPLNRRYWG